VFDGGISRTVVADCLVVAALISGLLLAIDDCARNSYFLNGAEEDHVQAVR
jgi:hypothetical protein